MAEGGWLKLYRELIEKPIWKCTTPEQKAILITLLCMANHEENEWIWQGRKYKCKPGQFVTSLKSIAEKSGTSVKNVRTALKNFEEIYDFLANESTNKNRLITIVNWELYQLRDNKPASKPASKWQASGKQVATNKNDKNDKNDKKDIYNIVFDHWNSKNIIVHKSLTDEFKKDIDKALKESTQVEILKAIDHYAEAYHDPTYEYCSYKWGIHELLTRKEGYKRFLDDGSKWLNYLRHKNSKKQDKQPTQSGNIFLEEGV